MCTSTPRPNPCLLAALLVVTGCASSSPGGGSSRDPLQAPDRFTVFYREDVGASSSEVLLPTERAWEVLPAVFRDLGFPAAPSGNGSELVMMTPHLQVRGELYAGELTSAYLNCGSSRALGPRADTHDVTFVIITTLTPIDGSRTRVETLVDGHARNATGTGGSVACNSTGKFEEQINSLLWHRARARRE